MREIILIKRNAHPGITLRRQKHLCKEKSSSRDYFAAAEASLQRETLIQGLLCGGKSISAKRNAHPGITLRRQKHLCEEKSSSRDYFAEAEASLQREKLIQGLFYGGRSISAKRNAHPGIILRRQKHLCKEKRSSRDYFAAAEASLQREKLIQGLLCGGRSISAKRNAHPGITLRRQKHLCKEKRSSRDYFAAAEASLRREKFIQGLFCGGRSISARRKVHPGML